MNLKDQYDSNVNLQVKTFVYQKEANVLISGLCLVFTWMSVAHLKLRRRIFSFQPSSGHSDP